MNANMLLFSFFLFVLFQCTSQSYTYGQDSTAPQESSPAKDSPELINGEFKVKEPHLPGLLFQSSLEGQPVPMGEKRKFLLRIKNPSETTLQFDEIKVGCNCLDINCEQRIVKAGEWMELVASYKAPTKVRSVKYNLVLSFHHKGAPVGLVTIVGELQNTLVILSDGIYEANGPISKWEIEILTSPPVENNRLIVELDKALGSVSTEIAQRDGKAFVRLEVAETALGVSGVSGRIKVSDSKIGLSDSSFLTLVKTPVVKVSPLFARFVDVKDRPGTYSTTFFVQAQNVRGTNDDLGKTEKNRLLAVEVKSDDYDLQINKTEINERIWRLDLFVNRSESKNASVVNSEEFSLVWALDSTYGKISIESDCYFLEKAK